MKYKVGDKVKIVSKRVFGMNEEGGMDKYLGSTMTIGDIESFRYRMLEDNEKWAWDDEMIEGLANKTKTLKTWEMIKELTENPKKKFNTRVAEDGSYVTVVDGCIVWEGEHQSGQNLIVCLRGEFDEWEEVKEPVDFMTAIKSGKRIKSCYVSESTHYLFLNDYLAYLSQCYVGDELRDILNGEWYIED